MDESASKKRTPRDHSEVLNGKRPKADAQLMNDILHTNDAPEEHEPTPPLVATYTTVSLTAVGFPDHTPDHAPVRTRDAVYQETAQKKN